MLIIDMTIGWMIQATTMGINKVMTATMTMKSINSNVNDDHATAATHDNGDNGVITADSNVDVDDDDHHHDDNGDDGVVAGRVDQAGEAPHAQLADEWTDHHEQLPDPLQTWPGSGPQGARLSHQHGREGKHTW